MYRPLTNCQASLHLGMHYIEDGESFGCKWRANMVSGTLNTTALVVPLRKDTAIEALEILCISTLLGSLGTLSDFDSTFTLVVGVILELNLSS